MGTITGGTVKYGETKKLADFENRVAHVELSFNIAEGEDAEAAITKVSGLAKAKYQEMTGNARLTAPLTFPVDVTVVNGATGEVIHTPEKATRGRKPAPKMPAQEEKLTVVEAEIIIPEIVIHEPSPKPKAEVAVAEPAKNEITDAELMDATTKCQQKVMNAPAIRKLLNGCGVNAPPGRIIDLPQDKRKKFLDGLNEIKPLA